MVTDPVGDLLTRLRNAGMARHFELAMPSSRLRQEVVRVLKEEGFIEDYAVAPGLGGGTLHVQLRYVGGRSVMHGLRRESKPGQRVYIRCGDIPQVRNGFGIAVLTTSQGVMTGKEAKKRGLGGELLCTIW
jgi:small subunit ribosomal protein S8